MIGEKITDYAEMASHGVMSTPALVVGKQVLTAGRTPGLAPLEQVLGERLPAPASP